MTDTTTGTSGTEKIAELAKGITFAMLTTIDDSGGAGDDRDVDRVLVRVDSTDG